MTRIFNVAPKETDEETDAGGSAKKGACFRCRCCDCYGEVGPHSRDLLEWIVHQFKIKCEDEGRRSDGCSVASLVRDFRNELHTNVQMAIAAGCGEMLRRAHFWEKGRG